ncbi:MAG: hypothetical protein A2277_20675 [Desulfobacterales bacterium RIFOXYA12_FULL_46_15]|nr:MAG: hypothetical protein A2277_20675 [Desulfobacterales bacterium RIFOXYA12_FULL_46_15]
MRLLQFPRQYADDELYRLLNRRLKILAEKGVEVIRFSNDDTDKLKTAEKTVWKEFETEIGKDWLDKIVSFSSGI